MVSQNVKTKQLEKSPNVIVKERFAGEDGWVKPGCLIWMIDNIGFKVPKVPSGLVEEGISVPRCRVEIPQVRD